ncbi:MAG: MFS transporter [Candidatus Bathyarchaeia archaeon]|jgi:predicted MFS family arabinose efflux permease
MKTQEREENKPKNIELKEKAFLSSLTLANFSTNMMDFLMSVFLIDIAITFLGTSSNANVATMSRLVTVSNMVSLAAGLILGVLCLKIKHKYLLMTGLSCIAIGAVGCFFATNMWTLQIFYLFDGIGTVLISSMAYTLIGEYLPNSKRGTALGYVMAGAPISGLIGSFMISLFFGAETGWRTFMIAYVFPIAIIALIVAFFKIPQHPKQAVSTNSYSSITQTVNTPTIPKKNVFACLIGNLFRYMASAWQVFAISFVRTKFDLTAGSGAIMILIGNIGLILGMLTAGKLANKFGRKKVVVMSTFCLAFIFIAYTIAESFPIATAVWMVSGIVGGLSFSSDINFTLGQMPKARGTLMSINSGFIYLGFAVGSAIGGVILASYGYQITGFIFASFLFAASTIFLVSAKEPKLIE